MENKEKLTTSKQIVAYIAELFPACFSLKDEAKPLKVGIFQDLAERLADDPAVSKTQLRAALRQYTSSWRYLYSVKEGAVRIDLDGNDCGVISAEHVAHAKATLAESKAKAAERRKQKQALDNENADKKTKNTRKKPVKTANSITNKEKIATDKNKSKIKNKPKHQGEQLKSDDLVLGNEVKVSTGFGTVPATILEINKDEVRVRLHNGLTILVKAEHLRS